MSARKFRAALEADSESQVLREVLAWLAIVQQERLTNRGRAALDRADIALHRLLEQVAAGHHRNPPLVVLGNPPPPVRVPEGAKPDTAPLRFEGLMSKAVRQVRYVHAGDGRGYWHPFRTPVYMWAIVRAQARGLLLLGSRGQPLWDDFR